MSKRIILRKSQMIEMGQLLKDKRTELGLSLLDIQKSVGISKSCLSRVERGERYFYKETLSSLVKALGITDKGMLDLLFNKNKKKRRF